jgi:uncharacterized protein YjiK
MNRFVSSLIFAGCLAATAMAQDNENNFSITGPPMQAPLAKGLAEISGLAAASEKSVYAHNDEHGIVYELTVAEGKILSAFALGDPTVKADFEGIAAHDGRIYLLTSTGLIYEAPRGANRERVKYNIFDTGVGTFCEAEGLAKAPFEHEFLILCKRAYVPALADRLVVFRWSLSERRVVTTPWINILYADLMSGKLSKEFRPSAIEWDAARQLMIVLSARSKHIIAVDQNGRTAYAKILTAKRHAQPEGVALMRSGDLVIADEGAHRGPGKLSVYQAPR